MMQKVILLSVLFTAALAFHTFDGSETRKIAQKLKDISSICPSFPPLSPIPPKYAPLSLLLHEFAENISNIFSNDPAPSITVNVVYDQDVLWTKGYGLKNISNPAAGAPDGDTMYRIGSNSKIFTTLLAEIAQEQGMFYFTEEVAQYVPEFSPINPFPTKRSITFAQLASHMAGLPRESPCEALFGNCSLSNDQMWNRIANVTLVNPPGVIPQYSNMGFATLGHVLEEIMDDEWGSLIQDFILDPLGMNNTGPYIDEQFIAGSAIGYEQNNKPAGLIDIGWESPAGSMYSSTNDLAKLISLFFRDNVAYLEQPDQILDSQTIIEWRTPRYINPDLTGYGSPWEIISAPLVYTKGGAINGYLSYVVAIPQLKLGMVILQSTEYSNAMSDVLLLFLSQFVVPFSQILQDVAPPPTIPTVFHTFLGNYDLFNSTISIILQKTPNYPVPAIQEGPLMMNLVYVSDYVYKISANGAAVSCMQAEGGDEQYVYFSTSTPPTFTIPGLFPGLVAKFTGK